MMDTFIQAKNLADTIELFWKNLNEIIYILEIEWGWNMTIATIISFIWALIETLAPIWAISIIGFIVFYIIKKA